MDDDHGTCQECGRIFRITHRGGIWNHSNGVKDPASPYYGQYCRGSRRWPKESPFLRRGGD